MKTCPNCGHENQEEDRFCSSCGTRLIAAPPPTSDEGAESTSEPPAEENIPTEESPTRETIEEGNEDDSSIPPQFTPPPRAQSEWDIVDREPVDENWKMSGLGPPPKKPRRTWLWIIIAIFTIIVLGCCGFLFWVSATDSGMEWFNDIATQVSEQATEAAQ